MGEPMHDQEKANSTPNVIARSERSGAAALQQNAQYQDYDKHHPQAQYGAPFYAQLDSLPAHGRHDLPQSIYGRPNFNSARAHQHLDMSSLGNALPDVTGSPTFSPYQNAFSYQQDDYRQQHFQHMSQRSPHQPPYGQTGYPRTSPQSPQAPSINFGYAGFPPSYQPEHQSRNFGHVAQLGRPSQAYMPNIDPRAYMAGGDMPGAQQGMHLVEGVSSSCSCYIAPRRLSEAGPTPSYPRGPPRKPKQSGHALWVGNLPPGTTIYDLKDHFSKGATKDIQSLFLISKSNCAFVNYRSEESCAGAMTRFHDSRFQGVRLVCRLRRDAANSESVPSPVSPQAFSAPSQSAPSPAGQDLQPRSMLPQAGHATGPVTEIDGVLPDKVPEKFFVVKSLTMQDLEASVRDGIWATQSHNEEILNKAFDVSNSRHVCDFRLTTYRPPTTST